MVIFGQGGLEIGCGDVVRAALISTPLHEEAIAQAQHHSENRHRVVVAHPAAVVVVGDIQALMQTALNAPIFPVQTQPICRIESRGLDAQRYYTLLDENWQATDWTRPQAEQVLKRIKSIIEALPAAVKQAHERIIGERVSNNSSSHCYVLR